MKEILIRLAAFVIACILGRVFWKFFRRAKQQTVERYSYTNSASITLGIASRGVTQPLSPHIAIEVLQLLANVPISGMVKLTSVRMANVELLTQPIDAYQFRVFRIGPSYRWPWPVLRTNVLTSFAFEYSGTVPPGFVKGQVFELCFTMIGKEIEP